ncbi:hypothetical protein GW17_00026007 [Ensete ventricosum]|nr:hypothetical protein GW17_00026007 [Ensete ventricosum]
MEDEEITQEDAWAVISAYFEEKGLVRQQLDSFDEFISTTMQGIVDESADIEILPERQHHPGRRPDSDEVPIMLCSSYCNLYQSSEKDLTELGECPYDQVGYFIINGSEKVLIAQEKMSTNLVYISKKKQPNKYANVAEVLLIAEKQNRPVSRMFVRLLSHAKEEEETSSRQYIRATLPHIRDEIPIIIIFGVLGFVANKNILEFIYYNFSNTHK